MGSNPRNKAAANNSLHPTAFGAGMCIESCQSQRRLKRQPLAAKESVPIYQEASLTTKRARAIIIASFPEFRGARTELLDEGWDFRVFEVDARWLFRFPKREASVAKLNMERKLLSGLELSLIHI